MVEYMEEEVNRKLDGMLKWEKHWDNVGKKKRKCQKRIDTVTGVLIISALILFAVGLYLGYTLGYNQCQHDITAKALQDALGVYF